METPKKQRPLDAKTPRKPKSKSARGQRAFSSQSNSPAVVTALVKPSRAKTAYELFCDEQRPSIVAEHRQMRLPSHLLLRTGVDGEERGDCGDVTLVDSSLELLGHVRGVAESGSEPVSEGSGEATESPLPLMSDGGETPTVCSTKPLAGAKGTFESIAGTLSRELSQRWSRLTHWDREPYEFLAAAARDKHAVAMRAFLEATDPVRALKEQCSHLIPKRPATAYLSFSQDVQYREIALASLREVGLEPTVSNMGAMLGRLWRELTDEKRSVFLRFAEGELSVYREQLKIWQDTDEFSRLQELRGEHAAAHRRELAAERKRIRGGGCQGRGPGEASAPAEEPKDGSLLLGAVGTDRLESEDVNEKVVTPSKKRRSRQLTTLDIDESVLLEARDLGFEVALLRLANNEDLQDRCETKARTRRGARQLLATLVQFDGCVKAALEKLGVTTSSAEAASVDMLP